MKEGACVISTGWGLDVWNRSVLHLTLIIRSMFTNWSLNKNLRNNASIPPIGTGSYNLVLSLFHSVS